MRYAPLLVFLLALTGISRFANAQSSANGPPPAGEYFVSQTKGFLNKAWDQALAPAKPANEDELLKAFEEVAITVPINGEDATHWNDRKRGLLDLISFVGDAARSCLKTKQLKPL